MLLLVPTILYVVLLDLMSCGRLQFISLEAASEENAQIVIFKRNQTHRFYSLHGLTVAAL